MHIRDTHAPHSFMHLLMHHTYIHIDANTHIHTHAPHTNTWAHICKPYIILILIVVTVQHDTEKKKVTDHNIHMHTYIQTFHNLVIYCNHSGSSQRVTTIFAGPPSSPRGPVHVSQVTSNSALVSWQVPEFTGGSPLSGFVIELRESTRSVWRRIGSVQPTVTAFTLADMQEFQEYLVRIIACSRDGESFPLISDIISPTKTHSKCCRCIVYLREMYF